MAEYMDRGFQEALYSPTLACRRGQLLRACAADLDMRLLRLALSRLQLVNRLAGLPYQACWHSSLPRHRLTECVVSCLVVSLLQTQAWLLAIGVLPLKQLQACMHISNLRWTIWPRAWPVLGSLCQMSP